MRGKDAGRPRAVLFVLVSGEHECDVGGQQAECSVDHCREVCGGKLLELRGECWGGTPDDACFVVREWQECDGTCGEEALVCRAQCGRLERVVDCDSRHHTMLAIVPAVGGNICELPHRAVGTVRTYQ
jgi:hypothetical protein